MIAGLKTIIIIILTAVILQINVSATLAQTASFRFVAWGDTKSDTGVLTKLSPQVKGLNPAFTIYAGDLESDGFTAIGMANWKTALNGGSANNGLFNITFPIRGNHDDHIAGSVPNWQNYFNLGSQVTTVGASSYSALSDDLTYSFDYGNSRFIGLDVLGDVTLMSAAQIAWLDQRLSDAEAKGLTHAFVFWHGPVYSVDGHCCPTAPSALISVLNKHQIVSATFHGHEHVLTYVHMASNRISSITHPFEEFISGDSGAGPNTSSTGRYDYWLNTNITSNANSGGFLKVDVSGNNFTASFYQGGVSTPAWTKTFSKTGLPTATPGGATNTSTPKPSNTPTPGGKILGDCDGINGVDILDFQLLSNTFGKVPGDPGYDARCNFTGEPIIDILDYQILSNNFGKN